MANRHAITLSIGGNLLVMVASWVLYGWNDVGVHVAARNTARFSALWFIVGFSAPGLARWVRTLPSGTTLIRAFVAAHMVHYMSVIAVLHFSPGHFSHHPVKAGLIIVNGFLIVLITGLTASPQVSPVVAGIHTFLLYLFFFIFSAALLRDRFKPFRAAAVLLVLALILRLIVMMKSYRSAAKIVSKVVTA